MDVKVSFIIISLNGGNVAVNSINSIKNLKTKYNFNIFFVDNGSKDGSVKKVKNRFGDVKVIRLHKNVGTAAYDAAIKKSKAEYLFFTGGDVEFKVDMLDELVDFLDNNPDVAQAAPKYINYYNRKRIDLGGTWLSRSFYSGVFKNNALGDKNIEIPYIGTGLIRTDTIKKFGYLFDNDYFFYGEDVDLGLRIRLLGQKIYYIPSSIVYHIGSASRNIHKPYYLTFLMERNLLRTFFTTLSMKNVILLNPYVFLIRLIAIARDLLKFNFMEALARIKAIFWVVLNLHKIIKKRKAIQKIRTIKDKELFKFFSERYLLKR
jgi:GT2 family glycosyltransferase|tara:strand:- start:2578 stop:3534 length:957 start_codon:yes stop_codon:yes gene_type:complete